MDGEDLYMMEVALSDDVTTVYPNLARTSPMDEVDLCMPDEDLPARKSPMDEEDLDMSDEDFSDEEVTFVFWNLDDYPIPDSADLGSIHRNIVSALYGMGFCGIHEIQVYGYPPKRVIDELHKAGFVYFPERRGTSAGFKMPLDMISCLASSPRPPNLVLIGKQNPESEWHRVLQCLQSRNKRPVHVVDLPDDTGFRYLKPLDPFLVGGKPRSQLQESSKFQDFSERITPPAKGEQQTAVFWDAEDCPNPLFFSNPDEAYRKIEKALRERGCVGEISIWAYVDEKNGSWTDECLRNKTWDSRIYFLPGGDKKSRRNRMLNDILLWIMDSPLDRRHTTNVIVVSNQFRRNTYFLNRLQILSDCYYGVFLVTPTKDINIPDSPEWPGLLIDRAYVFGSERPKQDVAEKTQVFWNLEDYPIPDGAHLLSICRNIDEALDRMGFDGRMDIRVYGDHLNHVRDELWKAGITHYLPETSGGDNSGVFEMPLDMIVCAAQKAQKSEKESRWPRRSQSKIQSNFLVIAKQSPERGELHRVLECLKSRNYTALVVEPPDDTAQERLFRSAQSVYDCIGGGKPITEHPPSLYCDASPQLSRTLCEDVSKIQDFSERITPVKEGVQLGVFWDVVDCPFPPHCSNPDEIYRRIVEALREKRRIGGEVSIWAYVDEKNGSSWSGECLRNKTWDSSIYFLPGGDKASRLQRMLNDILLWKMDFPVYYPYVIVVSDQVREYTRATRNWNSSVDFVIVTPTRDNNKPESPEWPLLLIEEAYVFHCKSSSSGAGFEPCPKRHKGDAAEENT